MKFKFDGVEKISSKIRNFFQKNLKGLKMLKWDQDHDLQWKLTNQDPIILAKLSRLIILLKKRKNQTVTKDQTLTKISLLVLRMIWSARVRGWDQWERKPARSLTRLKQKEIREKLRSYYDAGISAAEVI